MKKIITLLFFIILCFTISSCTNTNESNSTTSIETKTSESAEIEKSNEKTSNVEENQISFDNRTIKSIEIYALNNKIDMTYQEASAILSIEEESELVENVEDSVEVGKVIFKFEKDDSLRYCTIYMGKDGSFYAKLHNGKMYKMLDGFLNSENE